MTWDMGHTCSRPFPITQLHGRQICVLRLSFLVQIQTVTIVFLLTHRRRGFARELCILLVKCQTTFGPNMMATLIMVRLVQQPLEGLNPDPTDTFLRAEQLIGEACPPQPSRWAAECAAAITRMNFYNLTKWEAEK